jgi:uncharacterized membrane protein
MENETTPTNSMAIVSYLTIIGWIIALMMNNEKKDTFVSFHIRQMLGIMALGLSITILMRITGVGILGILHLGTIVLWILGIMSAFKGDTTPVPVVGEKIQEWFKGIS